MISSGKLQLWIHRFMEAVLRQGQQKEEIFIRRRILVVLLLRGDNTPSSPEKDPTKIHSVLVQEEVTQLYR